MVTARSAVIADPSGRQRARPRAPSRGRGITRFVTLLDATEALLNVQSPEDVGLYQIAEAAGIPPASVYHFFPTKEAAFAALVQRFVQGFIKNSREQPFEASVIQGWQDLMRLEQAKALAHHHSNPAAMKLLFGGYGGIESRKIDNEFNLLLAKSMYGRYDKIFHMPFISDPARYFEIGIAIMDSVWSLSYLKNARVTDEYAEEALAACYAYCCLFLPERLELREEFRVLANCGSSFTLPIA